MQIIRLSILVVLCLVQLVGSGCKPKLTSKDPSERLRAVQAPDITDQAILTCHKAAGRLEQTNLVKLAVESHYWRFPRIAVVYIRDTKDLLLVVSIAKDDYVRLAACWELNQRGDKSFVDKIDQWLDENGSVALAEACLNSEIEELSSLARKWASKRGYYITSGSQSGTSVRTFW